MRVLHLVSNIRVSNGIMNVIMNYYRNIDRNKIQFDFLYFDEFETNTFRDEITSLGGRIYKINRPGISLGCRKEIHEFFRQHKSEYNVLHIHEVFLAPLFIPAAKKNGVSAAIIHVHSTKFGETKKSAFRNRVLCFFSKKMCDYKVACSEEAAVQYYGKTVVEEKKYKLVHNAIDVDKYKYSEENRKKYRELFGINETDIVIGTVGRLEETKNQGFLLEILEELIKRNKNYKLLLIGEGSLEQKLRDKSKMLGLENNIVFGGKRTDVCNIYSSMDIFAQPSIYEGLSLAGVEAQAAGLPCVFSDTITKEAGLVEAIYISLHRSSKEWADKIIDIKPAENRNTTEIVKEKGYDIKFEAVKLVDFYLAACK